MPKKSAGLLDRSQAASYLHRHVFLGVRVYRLRAAIGQITHEKILQDILSLKFVNARSRFQTALV